MAHDTHNPGTTSTPRVCVTAFGKHPSAARELASPGLLTQEAMDAVRFAYYEGIARAERAAGAAIDSGEAIYSREGSVTFLRVWKSADARGNAGVMGALVAASAHHASWLSAHARPRLAACEAGLRGTKNEQLMRLALGETQSQMEDVLAATMGAGECVVGRELLPELTSAGDPARAIAHVIEAISTLDVRYAKVPRTKDKAQSLWVWHEALRAHFAAHVPFLVLDVPSRPHVVVCAGQPLGEPLAKALAQRDEPATTHKSGEPAEAHVAQAGAIVARVTQQVAEMNARKERFGDTRPRARQRASTMLALALALLAATTVWWGRSCARGVKTQQARGKSLDNSLQRVRDALKAGSAIALREAAQAALQSPDEEFDWKREGPLAQALERVAQGKETVPLSDFGPGAAGWSLVEAKEDGNVLTFRAPAEKREVVTFRRTSSVGEPQSVYLATMELAQQAGSLQAGMPVAGKSPAELKALCEAMGCTLPKVQEWLAAAKLEADGVGMDVEEAIRPVHTLPGVRFLGMMGNASELALAEDGSWAVCGERGDPLAARALRPSEETSRLGVRPAFVVPGDASSRTAREVLAIELERFLRK
jgi:hypothetical protein